MGPRHWPQSPPQSVQLPDFLQQSTLWFLFIEMEDLKWRTIKWIKSEILQGQKFQNTSSPLYDLLQEHHIYDTIYFSKANSATGINGIHYELWKHLDPKHKADQEAEKPSLNIVKTLAVIINNIQRKWVDE